MYLSPADNKRKHFHFFIDTARLSSTLRQLIYLFERNVYFVSKLSVTHFDIKNDHVLGSRVLFR